MGRNARIRRERKSSPLPSQSSPPSKQKDHSLLSIASSLVTHTPTPSDPPPSLLDKFLDRINPFPKFDLDKYQVCLDSVDFERDNQVLIAAIAWEGFQRYGKGFVLVEQKLDASTSFKYISQSRVKKTMKKRGLDRLDIQVIDDLINTYEPTKGAVFVYVNSRGEISFSNTSAQDSNPPECYQMLKAQQND